MENDALKFTHSLYSHKCLQKDHQAIILDQKQVAKIFNIELGMYNFCISVIADSM